MDDDRTPPATTTPPPEDTRGPLERIYDAEMSPLITRLVEISREHGIPIFVNAELDGEPDRQLMCTTRQHPPGQCSRRMYWLGQVVLDPRWGSASHIRFIRYDTPEPAGSSGDN